MFWTALAALICFILALVGASFAGIDFLILGFCFVAVHLLVGSALPWRPRQT